MRRLAKTTLLAALGAIPATVLAAPAGAAFGLHGLDVTFTAPDGAPSMAAGTHPYAWTTTLQANTVEEAGTKPEEAVKSLILDQPAGLVVDPSAVPTCSAADFVTLVNGLSSCPDASAVGFIEAQAEEGGDRGAIYNLVPPPGSAVKLGFHVLGVGVSIEGGLRPEGEQNAFATVTNIPQVEPFFGSVATIWGNPFDPAHDSDRGKCLLEKGECPVADTEAAFLTLPTRCTGPLTTIFKADSWQHPGAFFEGTATTHDNSTPPLPLGPTDCGKVGFDPQIAAAPTNASAESPSGLDFDLDFDDLGLTDPDGTAQSHVKKAVVTLPEGMTINPSQAEGLGVCSEAGFKAESASSAPGEGCPQSSKIGTIEVTTPLLDEALDGAIFVAAPYKNPFNSLIALYMVIRNRERGIVVRLPAKVEPDPTTGQLITTVDNLPQQPFSHFHFHFREGGRSPLVTPPLCGTYETKATFTPWSGGPAVNVAAPFKITAGPGGGSCPPGGLPPFDPDFEAGTLDNNAATFSPLYMRLTRKDGEQDMTRFDAVLAPGLIGKLAGVGKCSEAAIAAAKAKTGLEELAAPSCPASAQIGRSLAGAGVGPELTYVPGKLYLAGPYGGDPLSIVAITPAVAGPFDAGTVVVREALTLDPDTAEVQVDGAASDPIPHILQGIPLKLRDLRVYADRPDFTLNPTNCDPLRVKATLFGGATEVFSAADDIPVALASPYQATNCAALGLKPSLALKLSGGTKRGAHPALTATLRPRPGDANLAKAVVTLPPTAFLEQAHIRTVCTRVQFAAKTCPPGSIYGKARAFTPLLDQPLEGPVYLRSSSNPLPDLVVALHGIVDFNLVGRIDSTKARIRSSFESAPDAPVSKFVLQMQGAKKGLIVNSANLCDRKNRAKAQLSGHNGRRYAFSPVVVAECAKKSQKSKGRR